MHDANGPTLLLLSLTFASVLCTTGEKSLHNLYILFIAQSATHLVSSRPDRSAEGREGGSETGRKLPLLPSRDDGDEMSKENGGAGLFIHSRGHFMEGTRRKTGTR